MIKKCNKILVALIFMLLLLMTTVNATEMTLDELTNKIKVLEPNATYLYIIGEHVFTSEHEITTQDIMIAARTIKVSESTDATEYDQMTIYNLDPIYDDDYNLIGFKHAKNIVGTSLPKEKYEIKYIDYTSNKEPVKVDSLADKAYETIDTVSSNTKFDVAKNGNKITVTVLEDGFEMDSVAALAGTGVARAATDLLKSEGVASVVLTVAGAEPLEVTTENLKTSETKMELDKLFEVLAGVEGTAKDLDGKTVTVKINLEEGYVTEDKTTTFEVTFDKAEQIPSANLVNEVYSSIVSNNEKFSVSEPDGNNINITIEDIEMDSIVALAGTGVATAATDLLKTEGIASVVLTVEGAEPLEVTTENLKTAQTKIALDNLFLVLAGSEEATAGELAGKDLKVEINAKPGFELVGTTIFKVIFHV